MKQIVHDEKNGLDYQLVGNYYLPTLRIPKAPQIGRFGRMHYDYIRKNKKCLFSELQLSGKMNAYIEQVDCSAREIFETLTKQFAASEGVTEQLKADDQMEWGARMNNIRNRAEEIVLKDLIYS